MDNNIIVIIVFAFMCLFVVFAVVGATYWFLRTRNQPEEEAQKPKRGKRRKAKPKVIGDPPTEELTPLPMSSTPPQKTSKPVPTLSEMEASSNKIRILVVDDNPDTRENVTRLLYFEKDMEVIGQATNGREGIAQSIALKPHIVLMDINMPDIDGITATSQMATEAPYSQVIIMSVQTEAHYMRQAMAAGARDFQPKPFTAEELVTGIRRVFERSQNTYAQLEAAARYRAAQAELDNATPERNQEEAPLIAVYSPKGGVGTSVLAVNLAVALQQQVNEVSLMDGDLQFGDILVHLNSRTTRTISDLVHESEVDVELLPDILIAHNSGIKLLLAPLEPAAADEITVPMVSTTLDGLKTVSQIVVADTQSQLTERCKTLLDKADYILVVATPVLPAIKDTKAFLELARDTYRYPEEKLGVIINRSNIPGGVRLEQIEKTLKVSHSFHIPHDPRLNNATTKGVPVVQSDSNAPAAQAIFKMAQQVSQRFGIGK